MQLTALLDVLQSASKVHQKNVRKMTTKEEKLDFTKKMKNFLVLIYCRSFEPKMKHD